MMRITDILYTIPDILLIILLGMALKDPLEALAQQPGFGWMQKLGPNMISIFIIFALLYWVSMARIVRSQVLTLKESEYVTAARALGASGGRIIKAPPADQLHRHPDRHHHPADPLLHLHRELPELPGPGRGGSHAVPGLAGHRCRQGMNTYPHLLLAPAVMISVMILVFNLFRRRPARMPLTRS